MSRFDDEKIGQQSQPEKQAPGKNKPTDPYNPNPTEPGKRHPEELPGKDGDRRGQRDVNQREPVDEQR